jgi:hypothetical protein
MQNYWANIDLTTNISANLTCKKQLIMFGTHHEKDGCSYHSTLHGEVVISAGERCNPSVLLN